MLDAAGPPSGFSKSILICNTVILGNREDKLLSGERFKMIPLYCTQQHPFHSCMFIRLFSFFLSA